MIEAVVRDKLGVGQSRAHERSEDLLTSTVFGILRYLPHETGLIAVIKCSLRVHLDGERFEVEHDRARNDDWLGLDSAVRFELEFWPTLDRHRRPDLLISLYDKAGKRIHLLVVEVKLDAGKTGRLGGDDAEPLAAECDHDQLVRYWQGVKSLESDIPATSRTLVYLTSHLTPPMDDLCSTLRRDKSVRLAWLSWRHVWRVVDGLSRSNASLLPASDLARLLSYHGFDDFKGFCVGPQAWGTPTHFWATNEWFAKPSTAQTYQQSGFWREKI